MNTALTRRAALGLATVSLASGLLNVFARPAAAQDDGPMGTAVATTTTAPIPFSQTLEYQDELKAGHITPALDRVVKNMERFYTVIQGDKIQGDRGDLYKGELFNPLDNNFELAVDNKVYSFLAVGVYDVFCMDEEKPDPRIQSDIDTARDARMAAILCKSPKLKLGFNTLAEDIIQTKEIIDHLGERDQHYRDAAVWVPGRLDVSYYKTASEQDEARARQAVALVQSKGLYWLPENYHEFRAHNAQTSLANLIKHGTALPGKERAYAEQNLTSDPSAYRVRIMNAEVTQAAFDQVKVLKLRAEEISSPKVAMGLRQ